MSDTLEYQRGYAAGRKHAEKDSAELKRLQTIIGEQKERVYMQCLDLVVRNCSGWSIAGSPINNAEGYCKLARIFANNAISEMSK